MNHNNTILHITSLSDNTFMARTFTTDFFYNNNTYTAVITQSAESINIYVPDESLHEILPAGRATYNPQEGLPIDSFRLSKAQHLVLNILTSMENGEQQKALLQKN